MYSICLFNRKGGVGKTTITVNLAACLSMYYNKRCLVVDCDPQGNTTSFLDVSGENAEKPGLTDYYNNGASFDEIVQHYHFEKLGRGLKKKYVDVDLIPGGLSMDEANIVRENQLKELIAGQEYDYVFFDCPPSMTDTSISALFASDYVLVPAYADSDSLCHHRRHRQRLRPGTGVGEQGLPELEEHRHELAYDRGGMGPRRGTATRRHIPLLLL